MVKSWRQLVGEDFRLRKPHLTLIIVGCFTLLALCGRIPGEGISGVFLAVLGYVWGAQRTEKG